MKKVLIAGGTGYLGRYLTLQRKIDVIRFCQLDSFLSVRLISGQIPGQVILNNFHCPLDTQRPERKY